jgi:hypothetical protein
VLPPGMVSKPSIRCLAGGTLYLFDKNECRFFRKDGVNWKKKPDGKTVRETHEKLKGEQACSYLPHPAIFAFGYRVPPACQKPSIFGYSLSGLAGSSASLGVTAAFPAFA